VNAIEQLIDWVDIFVDKNQADPDEARAELAALRAENEEQAKQIETFRRALKDVELWVDSHLAWYGHMTSSEVYYQACTQPAKIARVALASLPPSDMRLVPVEDIHARAWQLMDAARQDQTLGDIRGQLVAEFGEDNVERAAAAVREETDGS
jgi:hypothetical protein